MINNLCKVAILAGGRGTRLRSRTGKSPKSMALINGRPVLEHQLNLCRENGLTQIALLVHYQYAEIKDYFGDGSKFGVEIKYVIEAKERGTGGALLDALYALDSRFLVLYGDTYIDVDLKAFLQFDTNHDSAGTLFLHPNDHPQDSDMMRVSQEGLVLGVDPYPHPDGVDCQNLVNAALYILDKEGLENFIPRDHKSDLAKDIFPALLGGGKILYAYITPEYIKDMGTPERLDKVEGDIEEGLPERLSARKMRRAVFLDRDGTLNHEVNHLRHPDQLRLLDSAPGAIRKLNRAGLLAIGITNQPVVARGEVTLDGLRKIHNRLDTLLAKGGAYLDRLYFCPHHPEKGFDGEVSELKINCTCRKPSTGLIDQAVQEFNITRRDSWIVGDATSDILTGIRAGLKTILVLSGYGGRDFRYEVEPNFVAKDLNDAVDWILSGHSKTVAKLMPIVAKANHAKIILIGGPSRAGKTNVASVLVELFKMVGRVAHVLPLDSWLKHDNMRIEGGGVLNRYNLEEIIRNIEIISSNSHRVFMEWPRYDRIKKEIKSFKKISIGPSDVVIIEGVPALLDERLINFSDLRIHVDVNDATRIERLKSEYFLRGESEELIEIKIASRDNDEVQFVRDAANNAHYQINL
jgi:histidinol-phosphate phosphatase family protein